jgi:hypothetical protein
LFFRLEPGAESLRGYGRVILLSELQKNNLRETVKSGREGEKLKARAGRRGHGQGRAPSPKTR